MGNGVLQAGQDRTECGGSGVRFGAAGIPEHVPGSSHCNGMAGAEAGFRGAPPDDCPAARAPRGGFLETLALGGWRPPRRQKPRTPPHASSLSSFSVFKVHMG